MSEIDPWALPQGGPGAVGAGLPGGGYFAPQPAQPLNTKLPFVVIGFGVLYVLVSIVQIFEFGRDASLAGQILGQSYNSGDQADLLAKVQSTDNVISTVSWITLLVFLGTLFSINAWQKSLSMTLGSVGARQAVFRRAGYQYFRATWLVSIGLSLLLSFTSASNDAESAQGVISHDHEFMVYYGVRALVGLVLIFFALRLKKFSEEGVARVAGAYAPQR
jgi:hypothetical protein